MKTRKEQPDTDTEPAAETDALRLSDIANRDSADIGDLDGPDSLDFDGTELEPSGRGGGRTLLLAAVAVGVAAVAVVGFKLAYDRRRSSRGYRQAVDHIEDARDALLSAAAELPERGREALRHFTHR